MFHGSMVALITPMHIDGSIDTKSLHALIEWHITSGTHAIVAAGTTGESATLDADEQFELIGDVVKQVNGRVPVIAGTGSNSTRTAIKLAQNAKRAGADGCLIVTPYYNKPSQEGLFQHYKLIAEQTELPIILYNVPGRTACDLLPETIERLSKIERIIGVKEATGNLDRVKDIRKRCGETFLIYSGDDATSLESMYLGAAGVISVTANVAPAKMAAMCEAAANNQHPKANQLDTELALLHQKLFLEANPVPTKWALLQMGKISGGIRLPLLPLSAKYHQEVKEAMQHAGVQS